MNVDREHTEDLLEPKADRLDQDRPRPLAQPPSTSPQRWLDERERHNIDLKWQLAESQRRIEKREQERRGLPIIEILIILMPVLAAGVMWIAQMPIRKGLVLAMVGASVVALWLYRLLRIR